MSPENTAQLSEFTTTAKYLRGQPYKVRIVANLIKRRRFQEAVAILNHVPNRAAGVIVKILKSTANAALSTNQDLDEDKLYVKNVVVDEGPRMKRVWPRGRGRADLLRKRFCHIKATLGVMEE